jgi:hypothetical protein
MDRKRQQIALLAAAGLLLAVAGPVQQVHAQYGVGGSVTGAPSEEQLQKCDTYEIPRAQCNENAILAKERSIYAKESSEKGSGTSMFSTDEGQTWAFIGILGAVFGGVAAAFFVKGRGKTAP